MREKFINIAITVAHPPKVSSLAPEVVEKGMENGRKAGADASNLLLALVLLAAEVPGLHRAIGQAHLQLRVNAAVGIAAVVDGRVHLEGMLIRAVVHQIDIARGQRRAVLHLARGEALV